jgi:methylated-DNA-[protein]-cysteine S-methyltransferase
MVDLPVTLSRIRLPWCDATLVTTEQGLRALHTGHSIEDLLRDGLHARESSRAHRMIHQELIAYSRGQITRFSVPLDLQGTPFQRAVWQALLDIPYGATRSYGAIAAAVGRPGAARAVGGACHANPIGLIVPCHRVVGADGGLTGYAGGLDLKARLLAHEQRTLARRRAA